MCATGLVFAQTTQAEQYKAASADSSAPTAKGMPVSSQAQNEALEDLRYKHLWIAYSLIWLIVFVFMYRTYKVGTENRARLEALKSRLALLEKQDG
jgi:hypothetical protein